MKYLSLISIVFLLYGCDIESYFYDKKTKVIGYVCEVSLKLKFERHSGDSEFKEIESKIKKNNKTTEENFSFTLTEYFAPYLSKNREKNSFYYELQQFDEKSLRRVLTINVWPKKEDGFTSIKTIDNGYSAVRAKDTVILRKNTEQVKVTDGIVSARMWDYFLDLDTFLDWISVPETRDKVKANVKDRKFPFNQYVEFRMSRTSGVFTFIDIRYSGEEVKPDTREAKKLIYEGKCRAGLNL